jgi:hypothetical protein
VNIDKFKPYKYLWKAPKGLEATIKGGGEHKEDSDNKEDSQKLFQYVFTKNEITLKIEINQKNHVASIGKSEYGITEPNLVN